MTSLFVCGDILNCNNKNGLVCSPELSQIISDADYSICNFEAPISGFGKPIQKAGINLSQRPETIAGLKKQGFDLLLLANNHIMDFGNEALGVTIERARAVDLDTIGAGLNVKRAYEPIVKKMEDIKIGMINACEAQFGVIDNFEESTAAGYAWINHPNVDRNILRLKRECDFVVVFSHAGLENYPIPQREWRARYRLFCDLGADVVIGSHPHVPQGYENYGGSLIFYSLGNFYFDLKSSKDNEGRSFAVWLEMERGKPLTFKPVYHYTINGLAHLASSEKKIGLNELCELLDRPYKEIHDQMSIEAYDIIKRNLILSLMPLPYDGNLASSLRRIAATILGRRKKVNKLLLLQHLLKNEAYYYAVRHALEVQVRIKQIYHE